VTITLSAVPGVPRIRPGDDLGGLLAAALAGAGLEPAGGDVLVVAQKVVSKAEDRYARLGEVVPSPRARELGARTGKDARFVELVLRESIAVLGYRRGLIVVEHRLGFVMANAGIDRSNLDPGAGEDAVLLLPLDPDASAARLRAALARRFGVAPGVIVSDSSGRAWRTGIVGHALGVAGVPALVDQRGRPDLEGHVLEVTQTAFADQVAAAASLAMGEAAQGTPAVLVRGLEWSGSASNARALVRPREQDLFR